uniref:Uncharacterized protein n=1 Tax=Proboscia inermis TaxID=420281 RepID=A0A7S0GJB6_9STRA
MLDKKISTSEDFEDPFPMGRQNKKSHTKPSSSFLSADWVNKEDVTGLEPFQFGLKQDLSVKTNFVHDDLDFDDSKWEAKIDTEIVVDADDDGTWVGIKSFNFDATKMRSDKKLSQSQSNDSVAWEAPNNIHSAERDEETFDESFLSPKELSFSQGPCALDEGVNDSITLPGHSPPSQKGVQLKNDVDINATWNHPFMDASWLANDKTPQKNVNELHIWENSSTPSNDSRLSSSNSFMDRDHFTSSFCTTEMAPLESKYFAPIKPSSHDSQSNLYEASQLGQVTAIEQEHKLTNQINKTNITSDSNCGGAKEEESPTSVTEVFQTHVPVGANNRSVLRVLKRRTHTRSANVREAWEVRDCDRSVTH